MLLHSVKYCFFVVHSAKQKKNRSETKNSNILYFFTLPNEHVTSSRRRIYFSLQLTLCHVAAAKRLPVHCHSTNYNYYKIYIFWFLGVMEFICSHFENIVLLKPMLGGGAGVAHLTTGNKQTQLNRVCHFHFSDSSLLKDLTIQSLFFFYFRAPLDSYKL